MLRTWLDLNLMWRICRPLVQSERLSRPLILRDLLLLIYRYGAQRTLLFLIFGLVKCIMFGLWDACVQLVGLFQAQLRQINIGTLTPTSALKPIRKSFSILLHLLVLDLLKAVLSQSSGLLSRKVLRLVHQQSCEVCIRDLVQHILLLFYTYARSQVKLLQLGALRLQRIYVLILVHAEGHDAVLEVDLI